MRAFLGANSERGFYSLYDDFPGKGVRLHIIKGGPGCGKSGFMKKLAEQAEKQGESTERILCSGDPESLDGVLLSDRAEAWVDGTLPHGIEPSMFGIDADYVNLGCFFDDALDEDEAELGRTLYRAYREKYSNAYKLLKIAGKMRKWPDSVNDNDISGVSRYVSDAISQMGRSPSDRPGGEKHRFIRAVTCLGIVDLRDEYRKLCKPIVELEGDASGISRILERAWQKLTELGWSVTVCHDPLCPDYISELIVPECGVMLTGENTLGCTSHYETEEKLRNDIRDSEEMLLRHAVKALSEAKQIHDSLEQIYIRHMDFKALDAFTAEELRRLRS